MFVFLLFKKDSSCSCTLLLFYCKHFSFIAMSSSELKLKRTQRNKNLSSAVNIESRPVSSTYSNNKRDYLLIENIYLLCFGYRLVY